MRGNGWGRVMATCRLFELQSRSTGRARGSEASECEYKGDKHFQIAKLTSEVSDKRLGVLSKFHS